MTFKSLFILAIIEMKAFKFLAPFAVVEFDFVVFLIKSH